MAGQGVVATDEPSLGSAKAGKLAQGCLCPSLVVPHGIEFMFAVPEFLTHDRQQLSFDVVDMIGYPVCRALVNEGSRPSSIRLQLMDKMVLAEIRSEKLYAFPQGLPEIFRPSGEVFCSLTLEARPRRYHLRGVNGQTFLTLQGDFARKAVNGVLPSGMLVCSTCRCPTPAKAKRRDASYYEVRVAPFVDAGFVLSALIALEKAEAILSRGC